MGGAPGYPPAAGCAGVLGQREPETPGPTGAGAHPVAAGRAEGKARRGGSDGNQSGRAAATAANPGCLGRPIPDADAQGRYLVAAPALHRARSHPRQGGSPPDLGTRHEGRHGGPQKRTPPWRPLGKALGAVVCARSGRPERQTSGRGCSGRAPEKAAPQRDPGQGRTRQPESLALHRQPGYRPRLAHSSPCCLGGGRGDPGARLSSTCERITRGGGSPGAGGVAARAAPGAPINANPYRTQPVVADEHPSLSSPPEIRGLGGSSPGRRTPFQGTVLRLIGREPEAPGGPGWRPATWRAATHGRGAYRDRWSPARDRARCSRGSAGVPRGRSP